MDSAGEFSQMDLGDRRLDERVVELIESLSRQPMVSINAACGGLAETTAEYRYIGHISVTPEKLMEAVLGGDDRANKRAAGGANILGHDGAG